MRSSRWKDVQNSGQIVEDENCTLAQIKTGAKAFSKLHIMKMNRGSNMWRGGGAWGMCYPQMLGFLTM